MEAKIREEKAKFKQNILSTVGSSYGGATNTNKLRGAMEGDFFQKNNSEQKGWTFNFDGTITEFRKPELKTELGGKIGYQVAKESEIEHQKLFRQMARQTAVSIGSLRQTGQSFNPEQTK